MEHNVTHTHLLVRAHVSNPPYLPEVLNTWLKELVEDIDMKILIPPKSVYCNDDGNEGISGIVGITTSHASCHIWNLLNPSLVQFDLYSCKQFSPDAIFKKIDEWSVVDLSYLHVDRNHSLPHALRR